MRQIYQICFLDTRHVPFCDGPRMSRMVPEWTHYQADIHLRYSCNVNHVMCSCDVLWCDVTDTSVTWHDMLIGLFCKRTLQKRRYPYKRDAIHVTWCDGELVSYHPHSYHMISSGITFETRVISTRYTFEIFTWELHAMNISNVHAISHLRYSSHDVLSWPTTHVLLRWPQSSCTINQTSMRHICMICFRG